MKINRVFIIIIIILDPIIRNDFWNSPHKLILAIRRDKTDAPLRFKFA